MVSPGRLPVDEECQTLRAKSKWPSTAAAEPRGSQEWLCAPPPPASYPSSAQLDLRLNAALPAGCSRVTDWVIRRREGGGLA